jgi:signal transduction histidine kinase
MSKAVPGVSPAMKIRESQTAPRRTLLKAAGAALLGAPVAQSLDARFVLNLFSGSGAIPAAAIRAATNDPTVPLARRWLASLAEHNILWRQWDLEEERLEALLGIDGFQADLNAGGPLTRIITELEARVAALWEERERLADELTAIPAQSFAGAAAKVAVARELIQPDQDEGQARPLLARAIADLAAYSP